MQAVIELLELYLRKLKLGCEWMNTTKLVCLILVVLVVCIPCLQSMNLSVSADSNDDNIADYAHSTWADEYGQYKVYSSFSAGYWVGLWDPHYGTWIYDFKLGAVASSTGGGWSFGDDGVIMATAFQIDVTENTEGVILSTLDSLNYIWSTPEADGRCNNLGSVSILLMDLAMAAVTSAGASLTWTAVSFLIDSFANAVDESSTHANKIWRLWEWDKKLDECAQHMMFRADVYPNEAVTLKTSYAVFGYPFELMQPIPIHFIIRAPAAPNASQVVFSDSNHSGKIIEITRNQLEEAKMNGSISEITAERLLSSNEDVFYAAINTVEMATNDEDSEVWVDSSRGGMDVIRREIDRSEMIAHVFDRQNDDANDIVAKHIQRLKELNGMLRMIEGDNSPMSNFCFLDRYNLPPYADV